MIRLGINIDHVATLRNARGTTYPDPVHAAALAELGGADNITCHLREDRRHINDDDVTRLSQSINVPLNFEIAATPEMISKAIAIKPAAVTLVPERREELTTEGGLEMDTHFSSLKNDVQSLKEAGILVSMFVEPNVRDMELSKMVGADAVEIHTGHFCLAIDKSHRTSEKIKLLAPLQEAATKAHELGLQVHVGHGLHYTNAAWIQHIPFCEEANIGHAVIARAIMVGLTEAVREMRTLINDPSCQPRV